MAIGPEGLGGAVGGAIGPERFGGGFPPEQLPLWLVHLFEGWRGNHDLQHVLCVA